MAEFSRQHRLSRSTQLPRRPELGVERHPNAGHRMLAWIFCIDHTSDSDVSYWTLCSETEPIP